MIRSELEHLIRAASAILDLRDLVIIGSQSILGAYPDAPAALRVSVEADMYPLDQPERAIEIEGAIGEDSLFHATHGYYAQGVGPETAILPAGWNQRLVKVSGANTGGGVGWCLDVHDLVLSKYAASREKDRSFLRDCIRHRLVDAELLRERLLLMPLDPARLQLIDAQIERDTTDVAPAKSPSRGGRGPRKRG